MNVLIVEDEMAVIRAMAHLLEHAGHTVCWAQTGIGAVELLRTEAIHLVLLDITLAGTMTGFDVARAKHADPRTRDVPIIVISGMAADEIRHLARQENPLASALIVSKPVDIGTLLRAIESIRGKHGTLTPEGNT